MRRRLTRIGAACLATGLLGYLVLPALWWPALWWYVADMPDHRHPCSCGEEELEIARGPGDAPPGHMCIPLSGARWIMRYQGPPLLPHEIRDALCDVGIVFGGSFVLAVIGLLMLLAGAVAFRRKP